MFKYSILENQVLGLDIDLVNKNKELEYKLELIREL
jgi:hypothetical protein